MVIAVTAGADLASKLQDAGIVPFSFQEIFGSGNYT
jgi:hypothetical protein